MSTDEQPRDEATPHLNTRLTAVVAIMAQFVMLYVFWLLLSGRSEAEYLIIGAVAAAMITLITWPLLHFQRRAPARPHTISDVVRGGALLLAYAPWLLWNVMKANLQVAYIVLHPRLPASPRLVRFTTSLESDVAKVLLANSITLTPGTVTVDMEGDSYLVHALAPQTEADPVITEMERRLARCFGQEPPKPPRFRWVSKP